MNEPCLWSLQFITPLRICDRIGHEAKNRQMEDRFQRHSGITNSVYLLDINQNAIIA
jgi:hypothetical protein